VHGGIPKALCEHDSSLKLIDEVPNPLLSAHNNQVS
jgi:hypothetical protein